VAVTFELAEAECLLRITLDGRVTNAILLDVWSNATRIATALPPSKTIVDLSGITELEVSSDLVASIARVSPVRPRDYREVFVAPREVVFGMSRMFQILAEPTRHNLQIVRTMREAYEFLGVESPAFVLISDTDIKECPAKPSSTSTVKSGSEVPNGERKSQTG
jgi:hypothetical protein